MAVFNDAFQALNQMFADVDPESVEVRYYEFLDEIATAVVNYRIDNKLSQAELAEKLGVTQAMISKYESGDYNISIKVLMRLLTTLGYDFRLSISKHEDHLQKATSSMLTNLKEVRGHYQNYYVDAKKGLDQSDDGLRLA